MAANAQREYFKYTPSIYAKAMVEQGRVRVSLLDFYKNMELGEAIGDDQEGTRLVGIRGFGGEPVHISSLRTNILDIQNVTIVGFNDSINAIQAVETMPPIYVYCVSTERSIRIRDAFKADTCVLIHRPDEFFEIITHALVRTKKILEGSFDLLPCIYKERNTVLDSRTLHKPTNATTSIPVWQQKDPKYEYQAEVRGLWRAIGSPTDQSIDLECPELIHTCRIIDL